jgi:hypothetical protein
MSVALEAYAICGMATFAYRLFTVHAERMRAIPTPDEISISYFVSVLCVMVILLAINMIFWPILLAGDNEP